MNKLILAALLLSVATSASAGFKYFGKKGEFMNSTETVQERSEREARDAQRAHETNQFWQNRPELPNPDQNRKVREYPAAHEIPDVRPIDPSTESRFAPGGHRRKELERKNEALRLEIRAIERQNAREMQKMREKIKQLRSKKR